MKTKFTLLGGAALLAFAGMGATTTVEAKESWGKGAPEFSDPDGNIKFKVRGRMMYDYVSVEQDLDTLDGADADLVPEGDKEITQTRLRRARLGVEGQFDSKFKYKAEFTFLGRNSGSAEVEAEDVFLEYVGSFGSLVVGNQKIGSPLEEATSSRFVSSMERSFMTGAFGFGRVMGVGAIFGGQTNWSASAFVNTRSPNDIDFSTSNEAAIPDEPISVLARVHWTPMTEPTKILHLGGTVRYRDSGAEGTGTTVTNGGGLFQYRSRPETNIGDRLGDTGSIGAEDTFFGLEAATIVGPFWASAEYGMLKAENLSGVEYDFSSYNLQAGWFLTGESRGYKVKSGEFDRTVPNAPVAEGGMGAWELRGRYDFIDLTDGAGATAVYGGEMDSWTIGVNWSPAKNVRFMGEYVTTEVDSSRAAALPDATVANGHGDAEAIQFRMMFDF